MSEAEPVLRRCKCGAVIRYSNDSRCEDCFADGQQRWPGKSERVDVTSRPDPLPKVKK